MSSDDRWAKATAAVERIEEVESARRDPVGAQADLAALRRAAVRVTGCDVDADPSVILAALGMLPSFEERVGIVRVLRDAAGGALSPGDTAAVLAVLSRSVPAGEAPRPATPPLAQALDLLRRARAVLHKLDPAHEKLRAEIDALLAGTPVAPQSAPDASLEERAKGAREAYHASPDERLLPPYDQLMKDIKECWRRTVRAVDASRPELPRAPLPEVDAEDLWTDYRTGRGAMYAHERKAFFAGVEAGRRTTAPQNAPDVSRPAESVDRDLAMSLMPPRPEPPRAPLTEEEARIARGLQACAAAWEPDVRLIGNFTAREIGQFASAILSRGEIPPDVRPVSASSAGEWQCVSCHAREMEMHRAWCEVEGATGTVAIKSTPHTHPLTEADRARGFVPAWTDDKPNTWVAPAELDEKKA